MMKRLAGVLAGAALLGGLALANQDTVGSSPSTQTGSEQQSTSTGEGTGGSGLSESQTPATVPGTASGQIADVLPKGSQLIGTVVESKSHTLYLQHMGAVVPLRVDRNTRLDGLAGQKLTDLRTGDEVQVTFEVRNKIDNVALRIARPSATGGSGLGASEESRDQGLGGSGSAGTGATGEDVNVGRPIYPEEEPMRQPMDPNREKDQDLKPIY